MNFCGEQGVVIRPEFELATSDMLVQFARKNLGIACVVSDFAQEYVDSGNCLSWNLSRRIPSAACMIVGPAQSRVAGGEETFCRCCT